MMNHRESWAEERTAPSRDEWIQQLAEEAAPVKRTRKTAEEVAAPPPVEKKPAPVLIRRARREET
jgi:hypothetical protein